MKEQSSRSSRVRAIAILVGAVAVLVGANLAVRAISSLWQTSEDTADRALLSFEADDVSAIAWSQGGSDSLRLYREDDAWYVEGDEGESIDAESVSDLLEAASGAVATRVISADNVTDEMGLASSSFVTFECEDGATATLAFGSETSDGDGCYVALTGDDNAYVTDASLASTLLCSVNDLYETESGPGALTTNISSFAIDRKDGSLVLSYYENGSEACYTSEYQWFADDGSGDQAADTSSATSLIGVVNSVAWQSCVTTADDGTVDYGLGDPTLSVSMEYTTETEVETGDVDENGDAIYETRIEEHAYTLIVGNAADGGGYYAQPEGSSAVYTLPDDDVAELLDATAASLAPDDVCLMDWSTVDSIDASWDGGSCTITFVRDTTDEDADEGSSESSDESVDDGTDSADGESSDESDVETTYRIGEEDADTDAVEEVLSVIDALTAEGTGSIADAQEQTATLTFVIHRNTNAFAEMELSFTRYDNNFYLVSFNGSQKQLVSRTDIGEIEDLLDALASS